MNDMTDILDLEQYPLDRVGSAAWDGLVKDCRAKLEKDGLFNLKGFVKPDKIEQAVAELAPIIETSSFVHEREHNIYFKDRPDDLPADHPALRRFRTSNRTICADQMGAAIVIKIYEWAPFAIFLAAVMGKKKLWVMQDPLARVNVMAYREGQELNWHFDRAEFTTTLLLQAPMAGGELEYAKDLRTATDSNYEGVARLLAGETPTVLLSLDPGTLNIFRGVNTAHRVTGVKGDRDRIIAVFSYFEREGVAFSEQERVGFYGRAR